MPVLPLVESRRILPGANFPARNASAMMLDAARSLTDPPGLYHSALPRMATSGKLPEIRSSRSKGVLPTRSSALRPRCPFADVFDVEGVRFASAGLIETCAMCINCRDYSNVPEQAKRRINYSFGL